MTATPPAEPQFVTVSADVFPSKDGKLRLSDAPCLYSPGRSLPTCGVLPQPVADGRISAPIEAPSTHSNINPQDRDTIPDQSTGIGISQDSRPALPPLCPLLQSLLKVSFALFNSL
jgi:hypothetical protein